MLGKISFIYSTQIPSEILSWKIIQGLKNPHYYPIFCVTCGTISNGRPYAIGDLVVL